jgi:hypothetical protein
MIGWILRFAGMLGALLLAAGLVVWLNFDWVRFNAIVWMATPSKPFDEAHAPPAFDYTKEEAWAALPSRADFADDVVEGEIDGQPDAAVDVFLVHGTTYARLSNDSWNQPPDDQQTNSFTDFAMHGASVYNACCKIYAPRYRQISLGAFADKTGSGAKALDLAYADVETAFDYFLEHHNAGRPFILAGASQGGRHIFRLLKSRVAGTDLAKRMVAAYPLIFWMTKEQFAKDSPGIPICSSPTQTGCVITFNPVGPNLHTGLLPVMDQTGIICVNPLTWRIDGEYAGFELNLGTRTFKMPNKLLPAIADAKCDKNGRLFVSEVRTDMYDGIPLSRSLFMGVFGRDNYHSITGGLFYGNIRRNAKDRVDTFLAAQQAEAPTTNQ